MVPLICPGLPGMTTSTRAFSMSDQCSVCTSWISSPTNLLAKPGMPCGGLHHVDDDLHAAAVLADGDGLAQRELGVADLLAERRVHQHLADGEHAVRRR